MSESDDNEASILFDDNKTATSLWLEKKIAFETRPKGDKLYVQIINDLRLKNLKNEELDGKAGCKVKDDAKALLGSYMTILPPKPEPPIISTVDDMLPFKDANLQCTYCYKCWCSVPIGPERITCSYCPLIVHKKCVNNLSQFVLREKLEINQIESGDNSDSDGSVHDVFERRGSSSAAVGRRLSRSSEKSLSSIELRKSIVHSPDHLAKFTRLNSTFSGAPRKIGHSNSTVTENLTDQLGAWMVRIFVEHVATSLSITLPNICCTFYVEKHTIDGHVPRNR